MPITVYLCYIINDNIRNTGLVSSKDLQIIFIGEIFSAIEEAEEAIQNSSPTI